MNEPITLPALSQNLPDPQHGDWRIELWQHPILHRGHAFLVLVDPSGNVADQLHGRSLSRTTGEIDPVGFDGSRLVASKKRLSDVSKIAEVAVGPYDDIVAGKWKAGLQAGDEINRRNLDYKAHDPAFEIAGDGGQIQNSNSGAYTFGKSMKIDLDSKLRELGLTQRFPGWGRNLLDPDYRPYVAPPVFPNVDTP